jgi:hypothetical protein
MAKTFKGFVPDETIHFDLESPDGSRKATFYCKAHVPGSKFLSYMETAEGEQDFGAMARATRDIINTALTVESANEFWAFADYPDNGISLEILAEISGYLAESFAGNRPTVPQSA